MNKLTKEFILEEILDSSNIPNANYFYKLDVFNIDKNNRLQILYDIFYEINSILKCTCGKSLEFISFKKGYKDFCSAKCRNKVFKKENSKIYEKTLFLTKENIFDFFSNNKINAAKVKYLNIPLEFNFVDSPNEYIYCYENNILKKPTCECGNNLKFKSYSDGYSKSCSSKCGATLIETKKKRKQTCLVKYGNEIPSKLDEFKIKIKKTKEEKYGDENYNNSEKCKETCLEKYGVENIFSDLNFRKEWEENRITSIRKNSKNENNWVNRPEYINNNINKRIETCLKKYGVEHYTQSKEAQITMNERVEKIWETKKKNNSTNSSKLEKEIFQILNKYYKCVYKEYKDTRYPFRCDFYIKDLDLFIEYQGFFTHGHDIFLKTTNDLSLLSKWKAKCEIKGSDFYKNAIKIWTVSDVLKRKCAIDNKLNYLEIFDLNEDDLENDLLKQIERVFNLSIFFNDKELLNEYNNIQTKKGTLNSKPIHNKIIKNFQTHFYEKENELYKNPELRRKLIQNRKEFLNKKEYELTNRELLSGFKISGIFTGYSFFSPLWFKYFIEKMNITTIYDPFGGWGHRLLGSHDLKLYIYNDNSLKTYNGIQNMVEYLKLENIKLYNEDASNLIPLENYEAVFMCPPYDNLEKYEIDIIDFETLMQKTIINSYLNTNAKIIGIVIKENFEHLLLNILGNYISKEKVNAQINHFKTKTNFEYLYIWKK